MDDEDTEDLAAQPHDAFFKDVFSDPEHAVPFFQKHLPAKMAKLIVWETLKVTPGSFVNRSLRQSHSDLLFSVRAQGGRELLLYLIFEHQSSVDFAMPLRLLAYEVEILLAHQAKLGLPLPPVISFVLNQGPGEWTVSERFEDLFEIPPGEQEILLEYLPKFKHALFDLSQADPTKTEDDDRLRVALQLMKLAREKDLLLFLDWLVNELGTESFRLPNPFLAKALHYAYRSDGDLDEGKIGRILEESTSQKEAVMSLSEQLIAQGKAKGIATGRAEGKVEGKAEGKAEGVWLGKVQLLEEMIGTGKTPEVDLAQMGAEQLEARFHELEADYKKRFR